MNLRKIASVVFLVGMSGICVSAQSMPSCFRALVIAKGQKNKHTRRRIRFYLNIDGLSDLRIRRHRFINSNMPRRCTRSKIQKKHAKTKLCCKASIMKRTSRIRQITF